MVTKASTLAGNAENVSEPTTLINHAKQSQHKFDTFHFVQNKKVYGILIDPGAAKGLIGSDTLNDIINHILKPSRMGAKLLKAVRVPRPPSCL